MNLTSIIRKFIPIDRETAIRRLIYRRLDTKLNLPYTRIALATAIILSAFSCYIAYLLLPAVRNPSLHRPDIDHGQLVIAAHIIALLFGGSVIILLTTAAISYKHYRRAIRQAPHYNHLYTATPETLHHLIQEGTGQRAPYASCLDSLEQQIDQCESDMRESRGLERYRLGIKLKSLHRRTREYYQFLDTIYPAADIQLYQNVLALFEQS